MPDETPKPATGAAATRATGIARAALFSPGWVPYEGSDDIAHFGVSVKMLADAVLPLASEAVDALDLVRDYVTEARAYSSPECDECQIFGPLHARADALLSAAGLAAGPCVNTVSRGGLDVLAERRRQVEDEEFDDAHDDAHTGGEMVRAAIAYAMNVAVQLNLSARKMAEDDPIAMGEAVESVFPDSWHPEWFKPTTPRRDLVKAAALLIAEIDLLDRAAEREAMVDASIAEVESARDAKRAADAEGA